MLKRTFGASTIFPGLLLLLAGCGGSNGGSTPTTPTTNVTFGLTWGARSRAITGPSSALSARVVLTGALANGGDLVIPVNRRADPAAFTQQVTATQASKVGTFPMAVNFYAETDGGGQIVASAQTTVTIANDGTGIGNVTTENRVASVSVVTTAAISGTESGQLLFAAKDAEGDTIALSPGSGLWSLVDGGDNLALTADGIATGKQSGYANVRVTVDGVTSDVYRVSIQNDPNGDQNVISFDDLDTVDYNAGTPVSEEARLSDRYLNTLGIRFSSTPGYVAVVRLLPNDSPSPFNAISPVSAEGLVTYANEDPIVITFFDPKNPTVKGGTKSLAFSSDKDGRATTNIVATAYDALGNVVDTDVVPDTGGAIITVESETANIHRVVITGADGNQDGVSFDDFAFGPVVPVE